MSPLKQPSLLALRAFEAAARRLSFTGAARELHVSQAAISRHVRALEQDVAQPLFRRLHRRVELTPAGRRLAVRLTAGFQQIGSAVEAVRNRPQRLLRITIEPAFATHWLMPRLEHFSQAHPDLELTLETTDELRQLGRDADLAIRYIRAGTARRWRRARHLMDVDGVPMVAGSKKGAPTEVSDRAILAHRLLHDDGGAEWEKWFSAAGLRGYEKLRHLRFSDHSLALDAARRGQGVVLGTETLIPSQLEAKDLMVIGRTRISLGGYWLLQASDRATAKSRAAFTEWLARQINSTRIQR
jgi:LysR family transcriptional regulator, glycine cleavage system transcriptional activator